MSKSSTPQAPKEELTESSKTGKSGPEVLTKSGWPKTAKETIKMVVNLFLNFFPF